MKAICEVGRVPVQWGTFYEPIKVWDDAPLASAEPPAAKSKMLEDNLATA